MAVSTKERIQQATAELLRVNGYVGTGLKQIASRAHAPFGSIYHFFPGGKEELAEDAIRTFGPAYGELFDLLLGPAADLVTGVRAAFDGAADRLDESDYADACPIATVALEVASTNDRLRLATSDVFDSWVRRGIPQFTRWGIDEVTSRRLVLALIMNLEGAFLLARSHRSTEPLMIARDSLVTLCEGALAELADRPGPEKVAPVRGGFAI